MAKNKSKNESRLQLYYPNKEKLKQYLRKRNAERNEDISISEYVRSAIEEKMGRESNADGK